MSVHVLLLVPDGTDTLMRILIWFEWGLLAVLTVVWIALVLANGMLDAAMRPAKARRR